MMTAEEEEKFLSEFFDEAINGCAAAMPELLAKYHERVGETTPDSTFFRMLKRHSRRKVSPGCPAPESGAFAGGELPKKALKIQIGEVLEKNIDELPAALCFLDEAGFWRNVGSDWLLRREPESALKALPSVPA